ncbi:cysteine desulfurase [Aneurinibacillus migulanus]|uniref:cysteine desulfurase family protein n=1 Tax=Aneurinibacillus migulanus TaxID=47500 RepID=UPI0005BB50B3|nr:aminotransferase class V-fold PLP-dependent enzyme [Aneurinibacillus migulanus]KIV56069.1 cysteine desulfurase [Aneurinibacillus migulanus]KPD06593.1 cysteine desulfurase [Aneurinibacillus migulanus]CEH29397.1 Aminotransferase class V [Aneurinibacillus migulanus]
MLYLDNSATTRLHPEVAAAMQPYLQEEYGNPSSKYYTLAENAKKAVEGARAEVAALLGCFSDEVIFTSGATESNNMVLKGVADYYQEQGKHIIISKVEHPSVIETCKYLETKGYKVTYLDVDMYGRVNMDQLEQVMIEDKPIIVSLLWGNNELGSLNDIKTASTLCERHHVFFHTDATQVVGKMSIQLEEIPGITFLSCSAHKIHGPKGIGAAIIRKQKGGYKTKLTPLLHGGGQENEYRSGTLAVHNIVGFGKAAELVREHVVENQQKLLELEKECRSILVEKFGERLVFNSDTENKIPGVISIQLKGVNNELFIRKTAEQLALSTGSACSSSKPSHVLSAVGKSLAEIRNTLRFSLSIFMEKEDLHIINQL